MRRQEQADQVSSLPDTSKQEAEKIAASIARDRKWMAWYLEAYGVGGFLAERDEMFVHERLSEEDAIAMEAQLLRLDAFTRRMIGHGT